MMLYPRIQIAWLVAAAVAGGTLDATANVYQGRGISLVVVVKDISGRPVPGASVDVEFVRSHYPLSTGEDCTGLTDGKNTFPDGSRVTVGRSDGNGRIRFSLVLGLRNQPMPYWVFVVLDGRESVNRWLVMDSNVSKLTELRWEYFLPAQPASVAPGSTSRSRGARRRP